MGKRIFFAFYFFWLGLSAHAEFAAAEVIVYIETRSGFQYAEPVDHQINVRTRPMPFRIVLKNTSSSAEGIYSSVADGYSSISFELLGPSGGRKYIRRREQPTSSDAQTMRYLAPGKTFDFDMLLNERDWEGLVLPEDAAAGKLRVRAVYDNNGPKIYSDYYEIIFPGAETAEEKKAPRQSRTLSS